MTNPTFINPTNITETGEIQSEIDYIGSLINVNFVPVASNPEVLRFVQDSGLPNGFDGFTSVTTQGDTTILTATTQVDNAFATQDFLNLHELGRVLGLPTNNDTTDPSVSIMIPANVADTYTRAFLDTFHTFGTEDVTTLLASYGTANQNITGTSGNDNISGFGGNDTISALLGDDSLNGNMGNDSIFGGQGNDTVHGGQGNDTLSADKGNDQVWGDLGNDVFLFSGSGTGNDIVEDFVHGSDHIQLAGTIYAQWNGVHNHLTQSGADSVITFSDTGNTLTLHGITASSLVASDFIFS